MAAAPVSTGPHGGVDDDTGGGVVVLLVGAGALLVGVADTPPSVWTGVIMSPSFRSANDGSSFHAEGLPGGLCARKRRQDNGNKSAQS